MAHDITEILKIVIVPDDVDLIAENITKLLKRGADLLLVTEICPWTSTT